jgi:hypothetical protein
MGSARSPVFVEHIKQQNTDSVRSPLILAILGDSNGVYYVEDKLLLQTRGS